MYDELYIYLLENSDFDEPEDYIIEDDRILVSSLAEDNMDDDIEKLEDLIYDFNGDNGVEFKMKADYENQNIVIY